MHVKKHKAQRSKVKKLMDTSKGRKKNKNKNKKEKTLQG